jgi:beta-glucosidase-like glycosyl hydrolase
LPAGQRAHLLVAAMTLNEKITLVHTKFGTSFQGRPKPEGAINSAGYGPGIPRLGIPPLEETDAGLGLANPVNLPFDATALPCGLAIGASFNPALARAGGVMIAGEAKTHVGVDGLRRHQLCQNEVVKISDKGDRPWNRLAELAWIRRNIFSSSTE